MPSFQQLFVGDAMSPQDGGSTGIDLDRKLFVVRKRIEHDLGRASKRTYFPSLGRAP